MFELAKMIMGIIGLLLVVLPVMGGLMSSGSSMSLASSMSLGSSMSSGSSMMPGSSAAEGLTAGTSAAGYTQCQQEVVKGIGVGFFMGKMAALASQGYNITGYNAETDRFNAWIQQNFGNDSRLMMPKMQETDASMAGSIPVTPNN
ncbi:MAG: hypothetical protein LUQ22_07530 [Methanotrichaceae archaeon]|nr:hypothetical protein [Methanotrichaceae archaeon]